MAIGFQNWYNDKPQCLEQISMVPKNVRAIEVRLYLTMLCIKYLTMPSKKHKSCWYTRDWLKEHDTIAIHIKQCTNIHLRGLDALDRFSVLLYRGDNSCDFLFPFLHTKPLLKWGLLIKERICSQREQSFFSLELTPCSKGRRNHVW